MYDLYKANFRDKPIVKYRTLILLLFQKQKVKSGGRSSPAPNHLLHSEPELLKEGTKNSFL